MLFNSLGFFVFLAVVYTLYRLLNLRWQNLMLLAASYLFYGWWDIRFLFLLVASTVLDYANALLVSEGKLTAMQRGAASAWMTVSAFLFLVVQWGGLVWQGHLPVAVDWGRILPAWGIEWQVFCGTAGVVVLGNVLYPLMTGASDRTRRRVAIGASVCTNLAILGFFKYFNFFIDSANTLLAGEGLNVTTMHLRIILPVGVSFYTFQSIAYFVDIYRGQIAPVRKLTDYALFVAYFPQLVAGPIQRASYLLPSLLNRRVVTWDTSMRGLQLIMMGLLKKVAIADGVAGSVDAVYAITNPSGVDVAAATLLFAVQIYCDFSGYSDIARGVSKLLGIDLVLNFDNPYFSRNPSEFWRRWHISLSTWLRDYLYIPLGGNRHGPVQTYRNLMVTMLLGGLWHGAAWNFVLWGFYQGLLLSVHRLWTTVRGRPRAAARGGPEAVSRTVAHIRLAGTGGTLVSRDGGGAAASSATAVLEGGGGPPGTPGQAPPASWRWTAAKAVAVTLAFFAVTNYGWLLFRAHSMAQIMAFTKAMLLGSGGLHLGVPWPRLAALAGLPILIIVEFCEYKSGDRRFYQGLPSPIRGLLYAAMLFVILLGTSNAPAQFIYFQF